MTCKLSQETIEKTISFHGHSCPGLSIGIRASELARRELGRLPDTRMVCIEVIMPTLTATEARSK